MVELMFASGVLLVVSVAGFGAQVRSSALIDASQGRAKAMSDLETCMEEMLVETALEITGMFPEGEPIEQYEDLHLSGQRIVPTYPGLTGSSTPPDPLEIVLTATWIDGGGRPMSLRLLTAKAQ